MLGISLDVGAAQPRRGCKKEHCEKTHFNYVRFVKMNFFKAHLCTCSFIQMSVDHLGLFHGKPQNPVLVINNNTSIIWGNIRWIFRKGWHCNRKGCNRNKRQTRVVLDIWNAECTCHLLSLIPTQELKPLEREFDLLGLDKMLESPEPDRLELEFTLPLRRCTMRKKLPNLDFIKSWEKILWREKNKCPRQQSFTTKEKSSNNSVQTHYYILHLLLGS